MVDFNCMSSTKSLNHAAHCMGCGTGDTEDVKKQFNYKLCFQSCVDDTCEKPMSFILFYLFFYYFYCLDNYNCSHSCSLSLLPPFPSLSLAPYHSLCPWAMHIYMFFKIRVFYSHMHIYRDMLAN